MPNLSVNISGYSAIVADSITVTGAVVAASGTIGGNIINSTGIDLTNTTGLVNAVQLNVPRIYLLEGAVPDAVANYSILYSIDVAGKTRLAAKEGGGGTVVPLADEI